jgi:hypothetical protein
MQFGGCVRRDLFVSCVKPIEPRAYSTSRSAPRAPKAISPPCALTVSPAGQRDWDERDPKVGLAHRIRSGVVQIQRIDHARRKLFDLREIDAAADEMPDMNAS